MHIGEAGGVEVGEIAVEIMRVGPIAEGDRRQVQPRKSAIGLIEHVDADFFLHHIALVAQILIVHFQSAHAVGFKPQNPLERIGRHRFKIIRNVVVRRAVQESAGGIDELYMHHLGSVFRPLKHHVLEQVRESAASTRLEAKSNLVIDAEGNQRRHPNRRNHHSQCVFECSAFDRYV